MRPTGNGGACGLTVARGLLLAAVLWGLSVLAASAADAAIGAAIGSSPIQLGGSLKPGRSYALPDAYVENPGSEPARYHLHIERLSHGSGRAVPAGWVVPARNDFLLAPHRSARVGLTLALPRGATGGRYLSDVVAAAGPPHPVAGTALGAAAATKLVFQVDDPGFHFPGWALVGLFALAGAALLLFVLRSSGLRVSFERGAPR